MPSHQQVLESLRGLANDFGGVAVAWHVVTFAALLAIVLLGWRPSRRTAVALLSMPLLSVGVLGWVGGNPFTGTLFCLLSLVSAAIATTIPRKRVERGARWAVVLGGATLVFAWFYPHFLESRSPALYAVASPMGVTPCPTLAAVIGFGLVGAGFGSRTWSLAIGGAGLFYALFGIFRLGVLLDAGLLASSGTLTLLALRPVQKRWHAARGGSHA